MTNCVGIGGQSGDESGEIIVWWKMLENRGGKASRIFATFVAIQTKENELGALENE